MKNPIDLFLREKPVKIIISLLKDNIYLSKVARETNCTYSHTVKVLKELKKYGLVEFNKTGRTNRVKLTEKGKEIALLFQKIIRALEKL